MSHKQVRPITALEVPLAIALVTETLAEFGLVFGDRATSDLQMLGLPASYRDEGGEFFVALDEAGALLGTAGVSPVGPFTFELRKMYLRKGMRGKGTGHALLNACLAFVRTHNAKALVLDTTEAMTDAIDFYERNGFIRDDLQLRGKRCSRGYRLDL